jgi:molybdopterin-guanine dinucleotide biosynthesis adapter protein
MAKIINVVGSQSNVGKTTIIEGLIKEFKSRGLTIGTIKHDIHGFDMDQKGKDTYRHSEAGSDTVIISSKNKMAVIKKVKEEISLEELIELAKDRDIIIVEGYKNSNLRKIEVYRNELCNEIITKEENLIAVASDVEINYYGRKSINNKDFKSLADLVLKERDCY